MSTPERGGSGEALLDQATALLRQHSDVGWVTVRATALRSALAAFRPSDPVRGRHDLGEYSVRSTVLVDLLRTLFDDRPDVAPTAITCETDDEHRLTGVTLQVVVAFGARLQTVAAEVHAATRSLLGEVLGPDAAGVAVRTHVHVGDVTADLDELL